MGWVNLLVQGLETLQVGKVLRCKVGLDGLPFALVPEEGHHVVEVVIQWLLRSIKVCVLRKAGFKVGDSLLDDSDFRS